MSGGGFIHQSLHRDGHFDQAFLLQDVVRKTQFVLQEQKQGEKKTAGEKKESKREREGRNVGAEVETGKRQRRHWV